MSSTRRRPRPAFLVPLIVMATALSGCSIESPAIESASAPESPAAATAFGSKAEARAALLKAYETYLSTLNAVYQASGDDLERLEPLTTADQFAREEDGLRKFRAVAERVEGGIRVTNFTLQFSRARSGESRAYACIDVSGSRLVDSDGDDVTPSERNELGTVEVGFSGLKLNRSVRWTGSSVC